MSSLSLHRPAACTVLGLVLIGTPACDRESDGPGNGGGETARAAAAREPIPIPVPLPLSFPMPIEVGNFDQRGAYTNSKLTLAYIDHFTILARDEITGDLGIATVSNVPAIGSVLPAARANVGVVALGAFANTSWKEQALDLLAAGKSADEVVTQLAPPLDPDNLNRQIAVLDNTGKSACYIGEGVHGGIYETYFVVRKNCITVACQSNKRSPKLIPMADAFENSKGFPLPERLLLALQAGWDTVPEGATPNADVQFRQQPKLHQAVSAAMLVVREKTGYDHRSDVMLDLRVDLSTDPLPRLTETYYAWCWAVLGQRLISTLPSIDPAKEPEVNELNQRWLQRARRRVPIGEEK